MLDDIALKLMAQIMQEGMAGYKIANLLNDANKEFNFCKETFLPPSQTQERKENYANKWLSALKEKGWEQAIQYIAEQLVDESHVYFAEDESHPCPEEKIRRLKEKLYPKQEQKKAQTVKTHGKIRKSMLDSISNEDLKDSIYQDIKDIEKCISSGAWKPAVIMSGSILEAILSDWLGQVHGEDLKKIFQELYPNKKVKKVTDYTLEELINVG